jgi:hypothetical protein
MWISLTLFFCLFQCCCCCASYAHTAMRGGGVYRCCLLCCFLGGMKSSVRCHVLSSENNWRKKIVGCGRQRSTCPSYVHVRMCVNVYWCVCVALFDSCFSECVSAWFTTPPRGRTGEGKRGERQRSGRISHSAARVFTVVLSLPFCTPGMHCPM